MEPSLCHSRAGGNDETFCMTQPRLFFRVDVAKVAKVAKTLGRALFDVVSTSTFAQGLGDLGYGKARSATRNGGFLSLRFVLLCSTQPRLAGD